MWQHQCDHSLRAPASWVERSLVAISCLRTARSLLIHLQGLVSVHVRAHHAYNSNLACLAFYPCIALLACQSWQLSAMLHPFAAAALDALSI